MNIVFHPCDTQRPKFTIARSGRLLINDAAKLKLQLADYYGVLIGTNQNDPDDRNLYIRLVKENDGNAFRLCKSNGQFYLQTAELFLTLGIDFSTVKPVYMLRCGKDYHTLFYTAEPRPTKEDEVSTPSGVVEAQTVDAE